MKEEFHQFCKENNIKMELTGSQSKFFNFLLEHLDELSGIGDMWTPIRILQQFINSPQNK